MKHINTICNNTHLQLNFSLSKLNKQVNSKILCNQFFHSLKSEKFHFDQI